MSTKYMIFYSSDLEAHSLYESNDGDETHRVAKLLNRETGKGITIFKVNADHYNFGYSDIDHSRYGILKEWNFKPKTAQSVHRFGAKLPSKS